MREASMAATSTTKETKQQKEEFNKGPWRAEEDQKLAQAIAIHDAKNWTTIAAKAGLNRCAKSCRLRWMNYLRPNIKRGNISDQEADLIIRLHRLLGNRWSLIAARLPGRTDNEIKNYWNYHLSKKRFDEGVLVAGISTWEFGSKNDQQTEEIKNDQQTEEINASSGVDESETEFNVDDFFDFSNENPSTMEWVTNFTADG